MIICEICKNYFCRLERHLQYRHKLTSYQYNIIYPNAQIVSDETRQKLSEKLKGRVFSETHRRKLSQAKKGKKGCHIQKHSKETREKLSLIFTKQFDNGRIPWNKGKSCNPKSENYDPRILSGDLNPTKRPEVRAKISKALTGRIGIKGMLGKHHTKETIKKLVPHLSKYWRGKDNPRWKGGVFYIVYDKEFNKKLKEIVKNRDNYTCKVCDTKEKLRIHHIDYNKKNNSKHNLITLCVRCNSKANGNKIYWVKKFQKLIPILNLFNMGVLTK